METAVAMADVTLHHLPTSIARTLSARTVTRVGIGRSGCSVFVVTGGERSSLYLKVGEGDAAEEVAAEKARLEWLSNRLPVPMVLDYVEHGSSAYLLQSAVVGVDAVSERWAGDVPGLVDELAAGLRRVHRVPVGGCPFDHRMAAEIERARSNMERGRVDEQDFELERQGRRARDLFVELERRAVHGEDVVFTHGDYSLPNVILHEGKLSGFIDVGRAGVGDRYRDLAIAGRSLARNWGGEWVPRLFVAYGLGGVDREKIEFYDLLDEFF